MGEINEEKWQLILEEYDKNNDGKVFLLKIKIYIFRYQKKSLLIYY